LPERLRFNLSDYVSIIAAKGWGMKKILITVFLVFVGVMIYAFLSRESGLIYKTEKINRGDIQSACTATGTVNPLKTVLVGTQVSGRIKELYADYNSPVQKGQLVAEIDPATFEAQLEQSRANLLSARASLEKAEATLLEATRDLNRRKQLFKNSIIGKSELDTAQTNYEVAKSQVSVAKAQVVQAEAAFKFAETNLRYTSIFSPVDGVVISRNVDIGQTVAATFQTPTLFTIAQDLKKMQINTNVDEADIGKIEVGQIAEFFVDAYPEITFKGRIIQIRNAPIVVQNVVTYDVVITVDNPELKLKPGMTANVSIIFVTQKDVLRIPNAALRFRPANHENDKTGPKEHCVWRVKNDKLECVEVKTGIDNYRYTELVSGDLAEGQEVIVGYLNQNQTMH
jgi:HlyD family secretion protein